MVKVFNGGTQLVAMPLVSLMALMKCEQDNGNNNTACWFLQDIARSVPVGVLFRFCVVVCVSVTWPARM